MPLRYRHVRQPVHAGCGEPLRRAAAGARQALLSLAAQRWGIPVAGLAAAGGAVTGETGVRPRWGTGNSSRASAGWKFWPLSRRSPSRPPGTSPAPHPGHAASRLDAVTGDRRFVSDLDLPGMLYGAVLRPPVPGVGAAGCRSRPRPAAAGRHGRP